MSHAPFFGHEIKQRRASLDLTQEALAEKIGCAVEHIRKIEAGKRRPSRELAQRLAEVLQIAANERASFVQAIRRVREQSQPNPPSCLKPAPCHPHNLPLHLTSFIGREAELNQVRHLLATTRLLTVTDMGGAARPGSRYRRPSSSCQSTPTACGWWNWPR